MMTTKNLHKKLISFGLGLALSINLLSCATPSRTNPSYIDNIPSINKQITKEEIEKKRKDPSEIKELTIYEKQANSLFEKLYQKDSILAKELGKIPEFQDGKVDDKEAEALEDIVQFYTENSDFKEITDAMLDIGKKECRKYCSPLQALLWYSAKEELNDKGTRVFKELFNKGHPSKQRIVSFLNEFWFSDEYCGSKWKDYSEASERLNSPELIELYLKTFFKYDYDLLKKSVQQRLSGAKKVGSMMLPKEVFEQKRGCCVDASNFACALLKKAGYETNILFIEMKKGKVVSRAGGTVSDRHFVAVFKEGGKLYKLADTRHFGVITGPFESYKEVAESIENPDNIRRYEVGTGRYGW